MKIFYHTHRTQKLQLENHKNNKYLNINLLGLCTDICVVSNALLLKTFFPESNICVIGKACAGSTKEKHEAALNVMESCQIEIL